MMSKKAIVPFGDPILRKNAKPVTKFDQYLYELLDNLVDTLYAVEGRAGLAAPQIGVGQRVIVMDDGNGKIELINPEILERAGEQTGPEACLSFPGFTGIVKRARFIKIKTMTRAGTETVIDGEEFLARLIQHEMDHLDGVLYIDHIQDGELYEDRTGQKVDLQKILRLSGKK
jgi:peptide deformylase